VGLGTTSLSNYQSMPEEKAMDEKILFVDDDQISLRLIAVNFTSIIRLRLPPVD
jgi:hypothetical protein